MTSADLRLDIRPPRWARAWVIVFPALLAVLVLSDLVPLRNDPGWATRVFICLFAAALGWRLFRLAAIGTPGGRLVVRNHWRDRTVHRDDVAEVSVGYVHRGSFGKAVFLTLGDGSPLRLDVTEVPFGTRRLERQASQVREWVEARPRPQPYL